MEKRLEELFNNSSLTVEELRNVFIKDLVPLVHGIAVQPHSYTTVGIACMNEVLGHIEVVAHNARKGIVG